jgi:hypothetical protein
VIIGAGWYWADNHPLGRGGWGRERGDRSAVPLPRLPFRPETATHRQRFLFLPMPLHLLETAKPNLPTKFDGQGDMENFTHALTQEEPQTLLQAGRKWGALYIQGKACPMVPVLSNKALTN